MKIAVSSIVMKKPWQWISSMVFAADLFRIIRHSEPIPKIPKGGHDTQKMR